MVGGWGGGAHIDWAGVGMTVVVIDIVGDEKRALCFVWPNAAVWRETKVRAFLYPQI